MKMQAQKSGLKTLLFGLRPKSVGLCHWFHVFHLYVMPEAQDMSRAQPEKWQDLIAWFSPRLMPWCVSQTIISVSFALSPFRNFPLSLQVAAFFFKGLQHSPLYWLEIHTSVRPLFTVLFSVDLLMRQPSLKQRLRWCIVQIDGTCRVSVMYERAG